MLTKEASMNWDQDIELEGQDFLFCFFWVHIVQESSHNKLDSIISYLRFSLNFK